MGQIVVLVSAAVVVWLVWKLWTIAHMPPDLTEVAWSDETRRTELVGRDSAGTIRWRYSLPAPADRYNRIRDLGGEDYPAPGQGILDRFVYLIRHRPREGAIYLPEFENPDVEDRILSFDPIAGLRWEKTVREVIGPMAKRFPTGWTKAHHIQFTVGNVRRTVVHFQHIREWPSVIVVLDDGGAVLGRFTHAGRFGSLSLDDLLASRATWATFLLITTGTSAHGASVLAVLDALNVAGAWPEQAQSPYHCAECGPPGPGSRLYEFPRTEVEVAGNLPVEDFGGFSSEDFGDGFWYQFSGHGVHWYFSKDFERVRVQLGDDYWQRHEELEATGRLTHTRASCPENQGPRTIRAWRPDGGWRDLALEP